VVAGSAATTKARSYGGDDEVRDGTDGPTIELEPQLKSLDQVFSEMAPTPDRRGNWRAMAEGPVSFALQPGT